MANHESLYPSTPKLRFPEWQKPYFEAVLEIDPQQLPEKVLDAEAAIYRRLQHLVDTTNSREERLAINDAMLNLRVLKTEKLGYTNWGEADVPRVGENPNVRSTMPMDAT